MKRTLVKARKAERNVKKYVKARRSSFIEYFIDRLHSERKPLITLD